MPGTNLSCWFYLKIFPFISSDRMYPLFSANFYIRELEKGNVSAILIAITFLGALGNATFFSRSEDSSRRFRFQVSTRTPISFHFFFSTIKQNVGNILERIGTHLHIFTIRSPRMHVRRGLTSLALMRVVTIPPEQSAIMKVAYTFTTMFTARILY